MSGCEMQRFASSRWNRSLHYATANVTRSETSSPRWNRSGRNYARRRHAWRIINRSQDDRLEDAGKYVGGIIAEQREATRLREAIREEVERLRDGTYINMELDEIADRIERRLTEGKNDDER
jgi:hypothetical protein